MDKRADGWWWVSDMVCPRRGWTMAKISDDGQTMTMDGMSFDLDTEDGRFDWGPFHGHCPTARALADQDERERIAAWHEAGEPLPPPFTTCADYIRAGLPGWEP